MRIEAKSIKGFEDFGVDLGDVNVATGANAGNKTSFLSLVIGLFGKTTPRMLRVGAAEGQIRAVVTDENETWEITRRFTAEKVDPVKIKGSKVGRLGAPATFLKEILDPVSVASV